MKWTLGVSVVALILGVALTMTLPAQTITPDEAILKLFPQEVQGIANVDVDSLMNAPLVRDYLKDKGTPKLPSGLAELQAATGFDAARDLASLTVGRGRAHDALVVARARYDQFKLDQFMRDKNIPTESYLGRTIYYPRGAEKGGPAIAMFDGLLITGADSLVRQAIDRTAAPASSVLQNQDLVDEIRSIEAGSQVWAVGEFRFDELPLPRQRPAQADELLKSFKGGTYQMHVGQDLHVRAIGKFDTPENAMALSDLVRGFIAIAKFQVARDPDMIRLLDGLSIDVEGSQMVLNFNASGDLIKKVPAAGRRLHGMRRAI